MLKDIELTNEQKEIYKKVCETFRDEYDCDLDNGYMVQISRTKEDILEQDFESISDSDFEAITEKIYYDDSIV